jgi:hypothetical protein
MDLEVGPSGDIYVAQHFVPRVTVFNAEGRFARTLGRAGQGPGEFEVAAMRLAWLHDTLWVADAYTGHLFRPDGTESRQVRFQTAVPEDGSVFRPGLPLADGSFLGMRSLSGNVPMFYRAATVSVPRFSATGQRLGAIARVRQRLMVWAGDDVVQHPLDSNLSGRLPFASTADGTSIVLLGAIREGGQASSFELVRIGVKGDTLMRGFIPYEPRPVTRSQQSWLAEAFANNMAGDYQSGTAWRPMSDAERARERRRWAEAITFPRFHPPVRQIVTGRDGSIWLLRELRLDPQVDRWELYTSEGKLEGAVEIREGRSTSIPWYPRFNLLRATRDELWGTTIDELEVPYIHRFRVDRRCRS